MGPLRNYKLPDGTTRQYREGEQPKGAMAVAVAAVPETPETRAAKIAEAEAPSKAPARRRTSRKPAAKGGE